MRKLFGLTIFVNILFVLNIAFTQGLNSIHTPDGINVIAVGDQGKIFRSSNSGATWASYSFNSENLNCVYSYGNDVWIAGQNGNVYKTAKSISPISTYNVGESFTIRSIYFHNSDVGFLCGDGGRVYKTINGGVDWTPINTGIGSDNLNSIYSLDEMKIIVAGDNGKVYLTENRGDSWSAQNVNTTRNLLKARYYSDGIIIVGEYGTLITKSSSGTWENVATRTESDFRGVTGTSFANTRVCGGGGFIRNNLNGSSNFFNFEINPMLANLKDIFYYDDNTGFAVSSLNYAIIKTTNSGVNWELPAGTSISLNWIQKTPSGSGIGNNLCLHPKNRDSYYVAYGNKVYVSRDKGESWTQIATMSIGSRAHSFYVSPLDTNIWMAAVESSPDKVIRSTDYGLTWSSIIEKDFSTYGQPLEMDQNDPRNFYFAPSNGSGIGVYQSTDIGATFHLQSAYNNSSIGQPCDLIVMWDSSNVLYMGDDGSDIYKSTDFAVTWVQVKSNSSSEVPSMCNSVFDKSICYATTWSSSQVYKTVNFGNNWSMSSNNSGSGWGSDLCREDPTVVLTGNYGSQSYLTTNGGANFFNVNSGLSGAGAGIMVPDRGTFLNMQTSKLFKLSIIYSVLTSSNENIVSSSVPGGFELYQNYPNPFNPSTSIKFALPTSGNVILKVYDQLGKEVASLADGFRNAGTYEVTFDASKLNSGVYFYKLTANNVESSKKMLLIK